MFSFSYGRNLLKHVYERGFALSLLTVRTYKVRTSLRLRCSNCRFVKRRGVLRVICKENPRHKQKQSGKEKKFL